MGLTTFPYLPTPCCHDVYLVRVHLFRGCALTTCSHGSREQPTACLLALAYQQIWPVNPYPELNDGLDTLPMQNSPSPSTAVLLAVSDSVPHGIKPPHARGYIVRWASHKLVTKLACQRR